MAAVFLILAGTAALAAPGEPGAPGAPGEPGAPGPTGLAREVTGPAGPELGAREEPRPTEHPLLWAVEREGAATSWLYGTIHTPDPRLAVLPAAVSEAVGLAEAVYAEWPLDDELEREPVASMFQRAKGPMRAVPPEGLHARDRETGKLAGDLELPEPLEPPGPPESQGGTSEPKPIALLGATLDPREACECRGVRTGEGLVTCYLAGDLDELWQQVEDGLPSEPVRRAGSPELLIRNRNECLAVRIAALLTERPRRACFFAVDAAHLPTEEGVIQRLERQGFSLRRVPAEPRPSSPAPPSPPWRRDGRRDSSRIFEPSDWGRI